jgi:hypothetical protein
LCAFIDAGLIDDPLGARGLMVVLTWVGGYFVGALFIWSIVRSINRYDEPPPGTQDVRGIETPTITRRRVAVMTAMISMGLILAVYVGQYIPACGAGLIVVFIGAAFGVCRNIR